MSDFKLTDNDARMFLRMFEALTELAMDDETEVVHLETAVYSEGAFVVDGVSTEGMPKVSIVPLVDIQKYLFGEPSV